MAGIVIPGKINGRGVNCSGGQAVRSVKGGGRFCGSAVVTLPRTVGSLICPDLVAVRGVRRQGQIYI